MLIFWMPYLQISYGLNKPKSLQIGKAQFLPDTDQTWLDITALPRPGYLKNFRDFPSLTDGESGDPIYGTILVSDDQEWLIRHADTAVAILYFLGDKSSKGLPAEKFAYQPVFRDVNEGDNTLVRFNTKHGSFIEGEGSIVMYPPLAIRGNQSEFQIFPQREENRNLLDRFSSNAYDRIVVAVRQYFRAQFSEFFTSPIAEDFATYCSSIEAALDMSQGTAVGDEFVKKLTAVYGVDSMRESFFLGLYVARSLHVHGSSDAALNVADENKRTKAYRFFASIPGRWSAVRAVTREVILRALGFRIPDFAIGTPPDSARPYLETLLSSDTTWQDGKRWLLRSKAAAAIIRMDDSEFDTIRGLADRLKDTFNWQCVRDQPKLGDVFGALVTCAIVIGHLTNSEGPIYSESDALGKAADEGNSDAISDWLWTNLAWKGCYAIGRIDTIKLISWNIASFLRK
jgi:hypothetical protein